MATHPDVNTIEEALELAKATPEEEAFVIARALTPDYVRHNETLQYAIKVAAEKERLAYWLARFLVGDGVASTVEASIVLGRMGYPYERLKGLLEHGEPRSSIA